MSEGDTSPPCQSGTGRPSAPDVHTEEGNRPSGGECVCLRREGWLVGEGKGYKGLSPLL